MAFLPTLFFNASVIRAVKPLKRRMVSVWDWWLEET